METKQTAVDILFNEIRDSKAFLPDNLFNYLEDVYKKSKQMEKEQIMDSYEYGNCDWEFGIYIKGEQYYNKTYK
jgi:hypothetical protein